MCALASSEEKPAITEQYSSGMPSAQAKPAVLKSCIAFALFFLVVAAIQWIAGSYRSELSHWPDALSHVINSLLLRDYAHHFGENPVRVAETYYVHYPKVSIGMWPPLYYAIAGFWTVVFGFNNISLLMLALSAALLASVVGWIASRELLGNTRIRSAALDTDLRRPTCRHGRRLLVLHQNLPDYMRVYPMRVNVRHALGRDLVLDHNE